MLNYQKVKEIISKHPELDDFEKNSTNELIEKAEKFLDINITGSYKNFLLDFGAGAFGSLEILGVTDDQFENSTVPNGIWYSFTLRKEINFPKHLIVIHEFGNGELFCLDLKSDASNPHVVAIWPEEGSPVVVTEKIANSFGEFFLKAVQEELEEDDGE